MRSIASSATMAARLVVRQDWSLLRLQWDGLWQGELIMFPLSSRLVVSRQLSTQLRTTPLVPSLLVGTGDREVPHCDFHERMILC